MSSFEMAMVSEGRGGGSSDATSHQRLINHNTNGSLAPSIANSSMRKSVAKRYTLYTHSFLDSILILIPFCLKGFPSKVGYHIKYHFNVF